MFFFFCFVFKIIKLKAEARLELLKQIGVSVDTWLKSAMNQVMEELENERWARPPAVTSNGTLHSVWFLFLDFMDCYLLYSQTW